MRLFVWIWVCIPLLIFVAILIAIKRFRRLGLFFVFFPSVEHLREEASLKAYRGGKSLDGRILTMRTPYILDSRLYGITSELRMSA